MSNFWIVPASSGRWLVKPEGAPTAAAVPHDTQAQASAAARELVTRSGGGRLILMATDGEVYETPVLLAA